MLNIVKEIYEQMSKMSMAITEQVEDGEMTEEDLAYIESQIEFIDNTGMEGVDDEDRFADAE